MLGGYYLGQLYLGISGLPSAGTIVVLPSSHQLSSDNILLTQKHRILLDNATHALMSGNILLTQKHLLTVENSIHSLMSENAAITSEHFLGVNDSFHGLQSTEIQLTQKHDILVDSSNHSLSSGILDLIEHKTIVVQNTAHGHTVDGNLAIPVKFYLVVNNTTHSVTSSVIALTQRHSLFINNATHNLTSTSIGGLINLEPFGFGGGYGAIEAWGVKHFGEINIELPLNYLILADDAVHNLWFDDLDTFVQIFNMIRTGIYIKDFGHSGFIKSRFNELPNIGTVGTKHKNFGDIATADIHIGDALKSKSGSNGYIKSIFNTLIGEGSDFVLISEDGKSVLVSEIYDTSNPDASLKSKYIHNGALKQSSSNKGVYSRRNKNTGVMKPYFNWIMD